MKYQIINLDNRQRVTCPSLSSVKRVLKNVRKKGQALDHFRVELPSGDIRHALEYVG